MSIWGQMLSLLPSTASRNRVTAPAFPPVPPNQKMLGKVGTNGNTRAVSSVDSGNPEIILLTLMKLGCDSRTLCVAEGGKTW